jgi:nucleoside-diphosphate-sugar epimerase
MPIDVFDNSKLMNDTGWKPKTSWNEGIKLTMEWMLKNDY